MSRRRAPIWIHWSREGDRWVSEYVDDGGAGGVLAKRTVRLIKGRWMWQIELRGGDVFDYSGEAYTDPVAAQVGSDWVLRQKTTRKLFRQEVDRIRKEEEADIKAELREKKARRAASALERQGRFGYAPAPRSDPSASSRPPPSARVRPLQQTLALPEQRRTRRPPRSSGRPVPEGAAGLQWSALDRALGQSRDYSEQAELPLRGQQTGFRFHPPKLSSALAPSSGRSPMSARPKRPRRPPAPPKPPKPRPLYWQPLREAIDSASYMLEKHMHSFPRRMVSEGTYSTGFHPVFEPDEEKARQDVQAHLDALRALKAPRRSQTDRDKDNEAVYWAAVRKSATDFLRDYQRKASPGLAAHYSMQGGVQLRSGLFYGLHDWADKEAKGEL